ncbi:hypothetical protein D9611_014841 [Ephemerocybe angulata]|uniref:Uncharacterized protein n=1 Tax=Ephemerocybe angulata TaxID=980116 RepID=A0A8H5BUE2_9AGAR|nr:hypothetical protein D9611_014841 [Tulosesus angulatus]
MRPTLLTILPTAFFLVSLVQGYEHNPTHSILNARRAFDDLDTREPSSIYMREEALPAVACPSRNWLGRPLRPPCDAQHGHPLASSSLQPPEPQTHKSLDTSLHSRHNHLNHNHNDGDLHISSNPPASHPPDPENDELGEMPRPSYSTTTKAKMGVAVTESIGSGRRRTRNSPLCHTNPLPPRHNVHRHQQILPTPPLLPPLHRPYDPSLLMGVESKESRDPPPNLAFALALADPVRPWYHPSELEYTMRDDRPQETMIT